MSLFAIVLALVVIGVLLWLVNTYIPMDAKFKMIINVVAIIVVVIWLLKVFNIWHYINEVHV